MIYDFECLVFVHIAKLMINKTNTLHLPVSQAVHPCRVGLPWHQVSCPGLGYRICDAPKTMIRLYIECSPCYSLNIASAVSDMQADRFWHRYPVTSCPQQSGVFINPECDYRI